MAANDATTNQGTPPVVNQAKPSIIFPDAASAKRLSDYQYFEQLFDGDHYEAFKLRVANDEYNKAYSKLRYVMVNFAGMISKICADFLFSEKLTIKMPTEGDQAFAQALWDENNLDIQAYESALSNSYNGDTVFKVRLGKRHPNNPKPTIIIEEITPRIYFPVLDPFNMRAEPLKKELAWIFNVGNDRYLRKEIHEPGYIYNKVFSMKSNNEVGDEVALDILGIANMKPVEETGIEESLVIHIPNWKKGNKWNGISDYYDLDSLFFAVNNRMTKIDNVLDKHTDPILMVPPGVLDENGKVKKKALGVIEIGEGESGKPEYIVWDASLENAFKEIEKLVEFLYMVGEVSPDVLGLGTGVSDSGRALKFKLMRTIAKVARKKLYYYVGLRQALYVAQLMAKAHNVEVGGKTITKAPIKPDLKFADGLPIDDKELIEVETMALDAGITSKKDSIMRVYGVDEKTADQRLQEIEDEKPAIELPSSNIAGNPFNKSQPGNMGKGMGQNMNKNMNGKAPGNKMGGKNGGNK